MLLLLINCSIQKLDNFDNEKQINKNSFKIRSFRRHTEKSFKNNKFKKARENFCLLHYKRMRMRAFHLKTKVEYYTPKCRIEQKNIFYGFENGYFVEMLQGNLQWKHFYVSRCGTFNPTLNGIQLYLLSLFSIETFPKQSENFAHPKIIYILED